jgi:D-alanyl-lipoteichoic acid acyltransferase DltB (MBOAT superfamily)
MPVYGLLLLFLSTFCWIGGILIDKYKEKSPQLARFILGFGIVSNLLCLCYYKYSNFILSNICSSLGWIGAQMHLAQLASLKAPALQIILPLGISFFVFEFIHYLVDVYKGSKSVKSWMEFSAFAAFFPSQIAGPIKRYQDFESNLRAPQPWSSELFYEGVTLILQGLFKKICIADPLGWVIAPSYASTIPIASLDAWIAFIGFSVQIFCDFSGYTDMGRGSALLLGIRLPVNFQMPYISEDIGIFWRRWHISLSSWIRDYVYIPMGGSRCSYLQGLRNLFITMAVCGLWHGAAWQFIAWGSLHGLALIANREWKRQLEKFSVLKQALELPPMRIRNIVTTFMFVAACFVMFRAPDLKTTFNIFASLTNFARESNTLVLLVRTGVPVFGIVYLLFWGFTDFNKKREGLSLPSQLLFPLPVRLAAWTAALLFLFAARPTQVTPFIYFQF